MTIKPTAGSVAVPRPSAEPVKSPSPSPQPVPRTRQTWTGPTHRTHQASGFEAARSGPPTQRAPAASPPSAALAEQLGRNPALREFYHGLSPLERREFNQLFASYAERVTLRGSEGWTHGTLGNLRNSLRNSTKAGDHQLVSRSYSELQLDARRLESEITTHRRRLAADPENPALRRALANLQTQLRDVSTALRQGFGQCADWAAEVGSALRDAGPSLFSVEQVTRQGQGMMAGAVRALARVEDRVGLDDLSAQTAGAVEHTAIRLRNSRGQSVVFDPWVNGRPDLVSYSDWDPRGASADARR